MSTIVTRAGKGSPLTFTEADANFTNLNTDKAELSALAASSGAALIGFLQAGTGATARTLQAKNRDIVSVKDFGAIGNGVTDDTSAINAASLAVYTAGGGTVFIPAGTYVVSGELKLRENVQWLGEGATASLIKYTGSGKCFNSNTPSTRSYSQAIRQLGVRNYGTGTHGINMDSMSLCVVEDVNVVSFTYGVVLDSTSDGYCVYNRFQNVLANDCTQGFVLTGVGANANLFIGCRYNGSTAIGTTAWNIDDSNGCTFVGNNIDVAATGFLVTAGTGAGYADGNAFIGNRIEGVTTAFNLGTNVRYTNISGNFCQGVTTRLSDSGTSNRAFDLLDDGGLNFSASPTASADKYTLDAYREDTWTPTDASGAGLSFSSASGNYTKIGNRVFFSFDVTYPATANATAAAVSLPFAPAAGVQSCSIGFTDDGTPPRSAYVGGTTAVNFIESGGGGSTNANLSGVRICVSGHYRI